jgi:hypothetical protein
MVAIERSPSVQNIGYALAIFTSNKRANDGRAVAEGARLRACCNAWHTICLWIPEGLQE